MIRAGRGASLLASLLLLFSIGCGGDENGGGTSAPPSSSDSTASSTGSSSTSSSSRSTAAAPSVSPLTLTEVTAESGIDFRSPTAIDDDLALPCAMGGGIALFDGDGDGDLDLYLPGGSDALPIGTPATETTARYYRQVRPLVFEDATAQSGIDVRGFGQGVTVADYDNDGDLDILALNYGPDALLRNRGDGTFEDVTAAAGITSDQFSVSAAFADFDRDGHLDLFITRYIDFRPGMRCDDESGRAEICGPLSCPPLHDLLLRNEGDGTFRDVSAEAGIAAVAAAGLGVVCQDFDHDGWIDFYVTNDAYANHLWINQRDGTFAEESIVQGAAFNMNSQAEAGMGVVSEDFDGDGWQDLFMTHLVKESNTLYRNLGEGRGFIDATGPSGLGASSMRFTGFGTTAVDLELDGDLDLVIANGAVNKHSARAGDASLPEPWPLYAETNQIYLNDGAGKFTQDPGNAFCAPEEVSRGSVAGDLDDDGDLDLIVVNLDSPLRVYRNDTTRARSWLRVRAVDPALGRLAIGARIEITDGDRVLARTVTHAVGYGSAGPAIPTFGVGEGVREITVIWPSGEAEVFPIAAVDREVVVRRGEGRVAE